MPLEQEIIRVLSQSDRPLTSAEIANRIAWHRVRFPKRNLMRTLKQRLRPRTLAFLVRPPTKSVYRELIALQHSKHITSYYREPRVPARRYFEMAST
jgi:hypothetical protein